MPATATKHDGRSRARAENWPSTIQGFFNTSHPRREITPNPRGSTTGDQLLPLLPYFLPLSGSAAGRWGSTTLDISRDKWKRSPSHHVSAELSKGLQPPSSSRALRESSCGCASLVATVVSVANSQMNASKGFLLLSSFVKFAAVLL